MFKIRIFGADKVLISKRLLWAFVFVIAILLSFASGLYLSGRSEAVKKIATNEAVFVGKLTGKYTEGANGQIGQDIDFQLFWDVWDKIEKNYVDKNLISEKEMFYGALEGMVASLGDPYSVFMDPKITKEFDEDLSGTFEGIGAEIGKKNEILTVIAPLPETPAEKAGLKAGDKIYAINGESTASLSVSEAVEDSRTA